MDAQKKRIVICCDGTWNTPENPTNVVKVVRSLKHQSSDGLPQIVFYDQGVGTYNVFDKFIGGVFGKGVEQNVLDAYRFIAHNYQSGDEIYCFGFSRGAYTVRALGGMLHVIGLLPKNELEELTAAYKYYRTPPHKRGAQNYSQYVKPEIQMMAVWDTVGALGAPTPILGRFTKRLVGFFNTYLSPEIKNAYQALAIDERRLHFKPDLWTGRAKPEQTVEQVWFAGVHSDVGGGYAQSGLSDIALMWMIQKSSQLGLEFDENYLTDPDKLHPDIMGVLHDSHSLPYRWLEKLGMSSGVRQLAGEQDNHPINVSIHETVMERVNKLESYQPQNLVDTIPVSRTDERRHLARAKTRQFLGTIQTDEDTITCEILDYSPLGGVQVKCDGNLDEAKNIVISSSKFAKTVATCAWKKNDIYGLKFAA